MPKFGVLVEETFPALAKQIITSVNILQPVAHAGQITTAAQGVKALWDTGASFTAISQKLVTQLGLPLLGNRKMASASGTVVTQSYLAGVQIGSDIVVPQVATLAFAGAYNFDMLIGMDIIGQGSFLVNTINGTTHFSFSIPAIGPASLSKLATFAV